MPQMSIFLCPVFHGFPLPSKSKRQTDSALVCFGLLSGSFQYTHLSDFFPGSEEGYGGVFVSGPGRVDGWGQEIRRSTYHIVGQIS